MKRNHQKSSQVGKDGTIVITVLLPHSRFKTLGNSCFSKKPRLLLTSMPARVDTAQTAEIVRTAAVSSEVRRTGCGSSLFLLEQLNHNEILWT